MKELQPVLIDSVFTGTTLDPQELALGCAITNWDSQKQWNDSVYAVHGRSVVFRSPTRTEERIKDSVFSGIQFIGVGGTPNALKTGLVPRSTKPTPIYRVRSLDVSKPLERIFELHEIDIEGNVRLSQREYAPLCGMDEPEAISRKKYTTHLFENVAKARKEGNPLPFVVPELAAEGFYTEMSDPQGRPLQFQAYRVPLIDRLPKQLSTEVWENGVGSGLQIFGFASYLFGKTLRTLHDSGFAYMDGHIGNISLVEDDQSPLLFITDLGSVKDFKDHTFPNRHRGFDFLTHLKSSYDFFPAFQDLARLVNQDQEKLSVPYYLNAIGGLLQGYFPERFRDGSKIDEDRVIDLTKELVKKFSITRRSPQAFVESFEDFYRENATS